MSFHFGAVVADDSRYKQAQRRREEILSTMQALQSQLRAVDDFIAAYDRLFPSDVTNRAAVEAGEERKRARNILPPIRLAALCREILLQEGRPMTRSELLERIEARGFPLVGADPSKNLGTILWRYRDEFENIDGRGYWPIGVPLPDRARSD